MPVVCAKPVCGRRPKEYFNFFIFILYYKVILFQIIHYICLVKSRKKENHKSFHYQNLTTKLKQFAEYEMRDSMLYNYHYTEVQ